MAKMTREEFTEKVRSGLLAQGVVGLPAGFDIVPCDDCDHEGCNGWKISVERLFATKITPYSRLQKRRKGSGLFR